MSTQPLATIHPDARIAPGVVIDPFVYVAADVEIGEGTHLYPGAIVLDGARIGRNCRIHSGAVIAGEPQDLKFKGEVTTAVIGDNTIIRESATVNRGTASKGTTIVGSNCLIMAYSHIAPDCVVVDNGINTHASQVAGEVH
ncbi:MAG: acyl-[acyl-carrier-protein]--UDP-N-acetylglucosamine O-acyltransferase, partial [Muribaculaceae bacterium]|nr:acyl-[acyl-carrier-protein]--UDP-N-acetylglucosamine O-acyltransferase [Muribaculaceae bacterium]